MSIQSESPFTFFLLLQWRYIFFSYKKKETKKKLRIMVLMVVHFFMEYLSWLQKKGIYQKVLLFYDPDQNSRKLTRIHVEAYTNWPKREVHGAPQ